MLCACFVFPFLATRNTKSTHYRAAYVVFDETSCEKNDREDGVVRRLLLYFILLAGVVSMAASGKVWADDDDLLLLTIPVSTASKTSQLHANVAGATQVYVLNSTVTGTRATDGGVFHYQIVDGKKNAKTATSASNLLAVGSDGNTSLGLTSTTGAVKVLYTVTSPDTAYLYVALDSSDANTLSIIQTMNTGLVRINLETNAVEAVANGCAVAPLPQNYYSTMQAGTKPIQFDDSGNIVFNGYNIVDKAISTIAGLKRVAMPSKTVSALTDDSQTVQFFQVNGNGDVIFQATNSNGGTKVYLWKQTGGFIDIASNALQYIFQDDSQDTVYKSNTATITFLRSVSGGGVNRAYLPTVYGANWAVPGDNGVLYGLSNDSTTGQVNLYSILPYQQDPVDTISVGSQAVFPWSGLPVQISKGYMYFVCEIDPNDGYGTRDTINARGMSSGKQIQILSDKRYEIYSWKQNGGGDKLYFTARDKSATSATILSGVIDTNKLRQGYAESQYLTITTVASALGAAAQVNDIEVLTPKSPVVDPGYAPVIIQYQTSLYAEGIQFSKYMDKSSVEAALSFVVNSSGAAVPYMPVWFLQSLYLIPDLDGLTNAATTSLNSTTCYALRLTETPKDLWNWELTDTQQKFSTTINCNGTTCSYVVSPTSLHYGNSAANQTITLNTSSTCSWVIQSPDVDWLSLDKSSGTGSATISVSSLANLGTAARSTTLQVADQSVDVLQDGTTPVCQYNVTPTSIAPTSSGGDYSVNVVTTTGCTWAASSALSWATIQSGATGTGNGTVTVRVAANTDTATRTGTLQVAGQTISIAQPVAQAVTGTNLVVYTGRDVNSIYKIYAATEDGYTVWTLHDNPDNIYLCSPQMSYDGRYIFYIQQDNHYSQPKEIWRMNADGTNKTKIWAPADNYSSNAINVRTMRLLPDNSHLIFMTGNNYLYSMKLDGTEQTLLYRFDSQPYGLTLNPNNTNEIYFQYGSSATDSCIRKINVATGVTSMVYANTGRNIMDYSESISSDGKKLIFLQESHANYSDWKMEVLDLQTKAVAELSYDFSKVAGSIPPRLSQSEPTRAICRLYDNYKYLLATFDISTEAVVEFPYTVNLDSSSVPYALGLLNLSAEQRAAIKH